MNQTVSLFDNIAGSYYSFTPRIPDRYLQVIIETFQIKHSSSILDLGCGSGDVALFFAEYANTVAGVDLSSTMIKMAAEKDIYNKVNWIQKSVSGVTFAKEQYDLIFSFESFHLFSDSEKLLRRITNGLKTNGHFCIGWATYEWEIVLMPYIKETFRKYGLTWDYSWVCSSLPQYIQHSRLPLSVVQYKNISVASFTLLSDIVNYLLSVSCTAIVSEELKTKLFQELLEKFMKVYPSGESIGNTHYTIMYFKKQPIMKKDKLKRIMWMMRGSFSK